MTAFIQNSNVFKRKVLTRTTTCSVNSKLFGKVAVLMGGRSTERAISLQTGQSILEALLRKGVAAEAIDPDEHLVERLKKGQFDRAFIALHGKEGEDGVVQGILQMLGLPFTGSGVAASALAMDKARAKLVLHGVGLPTPPFGIAPSYEEAKKLAKNMGFPLSVKPITEGSSLGVSRVDEEKSLQTAFNKAAQYGQVMIEKWIEGRDLFVGIVGETVFPAVEVRTPAGQLYDYHAKYESAETHFLCPAPLLPEQEEKARQLSYEAFCALGCEGWGRVDLILDQEGQCWILEVNTIPGMTSHSLVPLSAKVVGIEFDELVIAVLKTSLPSLQQISQIA